MKNSSKLEINFPQQDSDPSPKHPVRFDLTLLNNGCYCLSDFESHGALNFILSQWVKCHTESQSSEISEKFYNEILDLKANKDQVLKHLEAFSSAIPKEDVSSICLQSMAMPSDAQSGENVSIDLDLQILNEREFSKKTLQNGEVYHGYLINGQPDGFGFASWKDGGIFYSGEFREGKSHGKGYVQSSHNDYYYGDFAYGQSNGKGERKSSNGDLAIGEFKDGAPDGYCEVTHPSGASYKGYWQKNKRHGEGIDTKSDGTVRKGIWELDKLVQAN